MQKYHSLEVEIDEKTLFAQKADDVTLRQFFARKLGDELAKIKDFDISFDAYGDTDNPTYRAEGYIVSKKYFEDMLEKAKEFDKIIEFIKSETNF